MRLRCFVAGLGLFTLASLAYVLFMALQSNPDGEPDYEAILFNGTLLVSGLIFSAFTGKLIGLSIAAVRFRRTCRVLQQRLRTICA